MNSGTIAGRGMSPAAFPATTVTTRDAAVTHCGTQRGSDDPAARRALGAGALFSATYAPRSSLALALQCSAREATGMSSIPVSRWLAALRRRVLKTPSLPRAPFANSARPEKIWESLRRQAWSYRAIW